MDLSAFYGTLFQGPNAPMMMLLDDQSMRDMFYPGLSDISCKQSVLSIAAISAVASEVALVEVADAKDVGTVQQIFQNRIDAQVDGGAFYPATVEVWENQSRIVTHGNYIMMIANSDCDSIVSSFNALF